MDSLLVKFKKPYIFEGQTYNEIDLSGLEDISVTDMIKMEKAYLEKGGNPLYTGMTLDYAIVVATKITEQPVEFFEQMPGALGTQIRNAVLSFFYKED